MKKSLLLSCTLALAQLVHGQQNPSLLKDINTTKYSNPSNFFKFNNKVFFSAQNNAAGRLHLGAADDDKLVVGNALVSHHLGVTQQVGAVALIPVEVSERRDDRAARGLGDALDLLGLRVLLLPVRGDVVWVDGVGEGWYVCRARVVTSGCARVECVCAA